ncbi:DUF1629 domain-containing protein [Massilia sp. W12]|uniref:imm11 family protein n=1 Tax=Massilia sp. W12 TaxID=3126507 RepID=UPI0030D3F967
MIYQIKCGNLNNFSMWVLDNNAGMTIHDFILEGKAIQWNKPPRVVPFFDKKRKKQKDVADFAFFLHGGIALSEKAYDAIHDFLLSFGELIQLDTEDKKVWLYNVTTLIDCVDYKNSEKFLDQVIREKFYFSNVPDAPCIFKDTLTAKSRIYLNEAAKVVVEKIVDSNNLTGCHIEEAGLSDMY